MKHLFHMLFCALAFWACSSARLEQQTSVAVAPVEVVSKDQPSDTMLYYSRGACFGMCPIFELTVCRNGKAIYLGKNHVDHIGRFQSQISHTDVQVVVAKAKEIGYFEMLPVYDNEAVQDLPNIKTGISLDGNLYRVRNRYKGPASLHKLYLELDSVVARQTWKPIGKLPQD